MWCDRRLYTLRCWFRLKTLCHHRVYLASITPSKRRTNVSFAAGRRVTATSTRRDGGDRGGRCWCACVRPSVRSSYWMEFDTWFPALRCRSRIRSRSRFRNRFRKNRVRTYRSVCRCWGVCAAVARQAQEAGRRVSHAKEWAELQEYGYVRNGGYGKTELDPIWTDQRQRRTYGIGERYFYVNYGVLTEFLRMNVILTYFCNGQRRYENGGTDTWRWKPRMTNGRTNGRPSVRVFDGIWHLCKSAYIFYDWKCMYA